MYEDELSFAFLDIHPINAGHVLVIPKVHEPDFYNLPDESYLGVMVTVKKISKLVQERLSPKRTGLVIAGFDVPHTHVHVIPMNSPDDITSSAYIEGDIRSMSFKKRAHPTDEEMKAVVEILTR